MQLSLLPLLWLLKGLVELSLAQRSQRRRKRKETYQNWVKVKTQKERREKVWNKKGGWKCSSRTKKAKPNLSLSRRNWIKQQSAREKTKACCFPLLINVKVSYRFSCGERILGFYFTTQPTVIFRSASLVSAYSYTDLKAVSINQSEIFLSILKVSTGGCTIQIGSESKHFPQL